jgi:hypothetical protein
MKRILMSFLFFCVCMAIAAWVGSQRGAAQSPVYGPIPDGQVAAQLVGRVMVDQYSNTQLFGYFPNITNLPVAFFSGAPSEATAYFTFRSPTFQVQSVPNGSLVQLFAQPASTGGTYNVYFNSNPNQNFTIPESFSQGRLIATFNPARWMATVTPAGAALADSVTLTSSSDFTIQGQTYNFANLGSAATMVFTLGSFPGMLTGAPLVIPFGAYAQQAAPQGARILSPRRL